MKKWECTVCGYIHEGDEPPEKCPVCGADRSKFVELDSEEPARKEPAQKETDRKETKKTEPDTKAADSKPEAPDALVKQDKASLKQDKLFDLMVKHHVHPVSVHIPNGVLPVSVIFIVLAAIFNFTGLSQAAFYNMVFVVIAMPLVLFSGYIEWRKKYGGNLTLLFGIKLACAAIVSLLAVVLVIWFVIDPQAATTHSSHRWIFLCVNFVMVAAAVTAGFIGGKLVFKD